MSELPLIHLNVEARICMLGSKEIHLTVKEFDLLRVLVREAGKAVSREQLMREVWGMNWWGTTKTLYMHMSWLRRKLGDDPFKPRYIATLRGHGFRLAIETVAGVAAIRSEPEPDVRVLLVKPGDTVLIGNVGKLTPDAILALASLSRDIGIHLAAFPADITIERGAHA